MLLDLRCCDVSALGEVFRHATVGASGIVLEDEDVRLEAYPVESAKQIMLSSFDCRRRSHSFF